TLPERTRAARRFGEMQGVQTTGCERSGRSSEGCGDCGSSESGGSKKVLILFKAGREKSRDPSASRRVEAFGTTGSCQIGARSEGRCRSGGLGRHRIHLLST